MDINDINKLLEASPEGLAYVTSLVEKAKLADELAPKVEEYKTQVTNLESIKTDLVTQRDNLKKKDKTTSENTVDIAKYNALDEQLKAVTEKIAGIEAKSKENEAKAVAATMESINKDLKSAIVSASSTHKAINPGQVFILMQGENLAGVKDGKPFFYKLNEKGQPVDSTAEEATKSYLDKNLHLVGSSGVSGTGNQHTGTGNSTNNKPITRDEARKAFLNG
jgi:hypothetical protein